MEGAVRVWEHELKEPKKVGAEGEEGVGDLTGLM